MKILFTIFLTGYILTAHAQEPLIPGKKSFEKKWVQNNSYEMSWFVFKDTARFEIGRVATKITTDKKVLRIVTMVNIKNSPGSWIDTTLANPLTLEPPYHSSYNTQRDMVLRFGEIVTGYYNDKIKNQLTAIRDTTQALYFDSNLYPTLITWLPLQDGYKNNIAIYDYNPAAKTGVIKATVENVKSGTYKTQKSEAKEVWIVTVSDEIANGTSTYYIDKQNRALWQQEIQAGGRKMLMQRVE